MFSVLVMLVLSAGTGHADWSRFPSGKTILRDVRQNLLKKVQDEPHVVEVYREGDAIIVNYAGTRYFASGFRAVARSEVGAHTLVLNCRKAEQVVHSSDLHFEYTLGPKGAAVPGVNLLLTAQRRSCQYSY